MKRILISLCILFTIHASAQTSAVMPPSPPPIYTYVEQQPVARYDMIAYLNKNLRYPEAASKQNIEGRVIVTFVVNEDGSISNCTVVRGIGGGCDEEAVRVMTNMPPWQPGKQNGKAVKVYYTQPISFKLETEADQEAPQKDSVAGDKKKVFTYIDQMPTAGYDFAQYLGNSMHYPRAARKGNIQGRVIVKFVVNEDGSISDCKVIKGIGGGCDEEALRVIQEMPNWKPGKQNGKFVKVYFTQPITFKLEN